MLHAYYAIIQSLKLPFREISWVTGLIACKKPLGGRANDDNFPRLSRIYGLKPASKPRFCRCPPDCPETRKNPRFDGPDELLARLGLLPASARDALLHHARIYSRIDHDNSVLSGYTSTGAAVDVTELQLNLIKA